MMDRFKDLLIVPTKCVPTVSRVMKLEYLMFLSNCFVRRFCNAFWNFVNSGAVAVYDLRSEYTQKQKQGRTLSSPELQDSQMG